MKLKLIISNTDLFHYPLVKLSIKITNSHNHIPHSLSIVKYLGVRKINSPVFVNRYGDFSTSASHVIVEFRLRLRNPRNPSQYHMKTCHKGKLSNRNVGSKDQGALTKI